MFFSTSGGVKDKNPPVSDLLFGVQFQLRQYFSHILGIKVGELNINGNKTICEINLPLGMFLCK